MFDVLVVGDANPDLVLRGDVRPRFGQEEQLLDAAELVLGGSSTITSSGCARLGLRTAQVACVGDDTFGSFTAAALRRNGVDTAHLAVHSGLPTGLSVILSEPGDRAILTQTGALAALRPEDVTDFVLSQARHLHVGGFYLLPSIVDGAAGLFARAKAAGLSTSLDTNWDPSGKWAGVDALLPHLDYLLPNAEELSALTGLSDVEAAAASLVARGVTVVLKDGARGARAWWPGGACASAPPAVQVVDTTGAGDSLNAGFLAGLLAGEPLERCVTWAVTAGSLSTRAAGGTAAQATRDELLAALP
ncbi:sugar kinase [Virgisporangium aliadipatigenens]|uniref:Sugar kinase n=1 Tax=Virgisporangium aliadipatigenens TaxID=741659 RepID=A0A8J3YKF8_9ACTN|nr:sugar kinase [Virgisporangium aliadipatigenens]GIJ45473.1 sugar kinase [Virgisporangium aliadipatigenens]